jgi:hypothetical protein
MANEYAPAKSKISLAPVKALTKPLIENDDMSRASVTKAAAKPVPALKPLPVIKPVAATPPAESLQPVKSPAMAKSAAARSGSAKSGSAKSAAAKLKAAKPVAIKPVLAAKPVKVSKTVAPIAAVAKDKIVAKRETPEVKAMPIKLQPVKISAPSAKPKPVAPVSINASAAIAPLAMLDTIRSVQERTGVLAQTLITASQADLSQMLAPTDPATILRLQVAAMARTQATFKAYWTDVFNVVQHKD